MPRNAIKPVAPPDGARLITDDPKTVASAASAAREALALAFAPNPGEDRGAYLERMRHARGMTSAQLAEAMGVGESFIWNAEDQPDGFAGPLHDGFWQLAADALNLPEDAFLSIPVTFDRAPVAELPPPPVTIRSRAPVPPLTPGLHYLRHDQLVPSPLNARKHFDDAALEETAGSILAMGLLQNLVAKPLPDGRAELVCGERRWRSIALLIERGEWDATAQTIPVMIRQMTEAQHRAIMLIENLARRDLTPLEEARGFAELQALDPDTYTTDRIAADCGFTPRLIQQRLALLRLPAPVLSALDAGQINVSAARALCRAPTADMQLTILAGILAGDRHLKTTAGIQETITRGMIPISRARFDIKDYIDAAEGHEGAQIVEFEGNGARYFPNADLFRGLQEAWAERRCHALRADGWSWARVEPTLAAWKYDRVEGMAPGAGCVIVLSPTDASVTEHTGLIPKQIQAAPTAPTWSQVDIEDLTKPPAATPAMPAATAPPPVAPDKPSLPPGLSRADTHVHRTAMDFFRGRMLGALAANPTDMMVLMILDRGRPNTDSLFERVHSGDCVLPAQLICDDDGEPGPLFAVQSGVMLDDGPPSEQTFTFADRDAMGRALLDLIQHADPAAIAETWAALIADTIFLDSGDLHPVWRAYATLRGIPLPAHFQPAVGGQ